MGSTRLAAVVAGLWLGLAPSAGAHHDFRTEFDGKQRVRLVGVITKIEWVHPHAWLYVDVSGPQGEVVHWSVQAASPAALARRGWRKDSLQPGMAVTIDAFRARSGKPVANGRDITLPDGRTLCANLPCRCCSDASGRD